MDRLHRECLSGVSFQYQSIILPCFLLEEDPQAKDKVVVIPERYFLGFSHLLEKGQCLLSF